MTIPSNLSSLNYVAPSPSTVNIQEFTLSGPWIKPAGAKMVLIELWGGGGAGGGGDTATNAQSGGGGGGAYAFRMMSANELADQIPVYVGAGGVGSIGGSGTSGTATIFGDVSFGGTYNAETQDSTLRNVILHAGGGAGGLANVFNGFGGYGGGTITSAAGSGGNSTGTGTAGYPFGSFTFGSNSGSNQNRYSYMGGGSGDFGENTGNNTGGGTSNMGGSGGGLGGGYNGQLPLITSNGGSSTGAWGFRSGFGGMGMNSFSASGRDGGPREGGGGGALGLPASMNFTTTSILIHDNNAYASGGFNGQTIRSTDPASFSAYTFGTNHNGITSISYDGTQYIGVTRRGTTTGKMSAIFTSTNGSTWALLSANQNVIINKIKHASYIQELLFFNGMYVGIFLQPNGFTQGIAYSYDLLTWTLVVNTQYAFTLREANGVLYVGGLSTFFRSTDGITWTSPTGLSGTMLNVAASPAGVVVVQTITTTTYRSINNGLTFTASATTAAATIYNNNVGAYGGVVWNATDAQFMLAGGTSIFTSPDGNTWTSRAIGTTDTLSGLATGLVNSINYYMVGNASTGGSSNTTVWWRSSNAGVTWASRNLAWSNLPAGTGGRGGFPSGGGGGGGTKGSAGGAGGAGGAGFARISSW